MHKCSDASLDMGSEAVMWDPQACDLGVPQGLETSMLDLYEWRFLELGVRRYPHTRPNRIGCSFTNHPFSWGSPIHGKPHMLGVLGHPKVSSRAHLLFLSNGSDDILELGRFEIRMRTGGKHGKTPL